MGYATHTRTHAHTHTHTHSRTCLVVHLLYTTDVSEFTEPEADDLPLSEDAGVFSPVEDSDRKARKDVHRKFLERQRSQEVDKKLVSSVSA